MLNFRNSLVHRDSAAGHQQLPAGQYPNDQLTAAQLHMDIHVQLRGGELVIRVLPGRQLLMTGSAVTVYEGVAEV